MKKYYKIPIIIFEDMAIDFGDIYDCLETEMYDFENSSIEDIMSYLNSNMPNILLELNIIDEYIAALPGDWMTNNLLDDFEEYLRIKLDK